MLRFEKFHTVTPLSQIFFGHQVMQQNAGMIFNTPHESIPKTKKNEVKMSNVKNPVDIPLYWLVNRDPYIGLL